MAEARRISILGGSGFVGRHLVPRLLRDGHQLHLLTRNTRSLADTALLPGEAIVQVDPHDPEALARALEGAEIVINLVGILNERGHRGQEFQKVHEELPRQMARICRAQGVQQVLHMSAVGAQAGMSPSFYLRTKGAGNNAIMVELGNVVPWTIFQPSVIFGPDDSFINRFATLMRRIPGPFPLACPQAKFAPVYVEDVVEAFALCVGNEQVHNKRLELCGPEIVTLREVVEFAAQQAGLNKMIVNLPDSLSKLQANIMEYVPGKPFSRDNYQSTRIDSVCHPDGRNCLGFEALGIRPRSMREAVPTYFKPIGQDDG